MSQGIPVTYVPARNTVLLSLALAYAETVGAADIFVGVNAVDYSGYPDCRPEYIAAFQRLANLATKAGVEGQLKFTIHTPLIHLTKAQIIRRGAELGVDYCLTHSCYDPDEDGISCGRCDACQLRRKGFAEAGLERSAAVSGYVLAGCDSNRNTFDAHRRNLPIAARRRPSDRRRERLRAHQRLQSPLPLLRYALRLVDAGRRLPFGRGSRGGGGTDRPASGDGRCRCCGHVVVTGGEPMLLPDLVPLCAELRRRGMHVTIETAGTRYLPVECDLMAVSPKLSNSTPLAEEAAEWIDLHERNRAAPDIVRRLNAEYDCQFKFVVGSPGRLRGSDGLSGRFSRDRSPPRICSCPGHEARRNWRPTAEWLEPYCREHGLTFCPRRHIEWFGCRRGT